MPGSIFDVKDFGARGDFEASTSTGTDDYPAFQRALDAIAALSDNANSTGAILWVPAGCYRLSQTLHIRRRMILGGAGPLSSLLVFDEDVDGIVVHHQGDSPVGG